MSILKALVKKIKPRFWDHEESSTGIYKRMFNFRQIWGEAVLFTFGIAVIPLLFLTAVEYKVTSIAMESEILQRTSRLVSNTRRSVFFFLSERRAALNFIIHDNTFEQLSDPVRLSAILDNLKDTIGGFADIGLIDSSGKQRTYVGPYPFEGKDYSGQEWFKEVTEKGTYISDVFLGFRNAPHLIIAVRYYMQDGCFYVLRASLSIDQFQELLSNLELSGQGDAFIINSEGILQTPSRSHCSILEKFKLPVPRFSEITQVIETRYMGENIVMGYAYITETPFILIVVKQKDEIMKPWHTTRVRLITFLIASIAIIVIVILSMATHLVCNIYLADEKRQLAMQHAEYANKMASIGRLAAGIAHEINNPLSIINEKAGLISDIFTIKKEYTKDEKLISLVKVIIDSVERCGIITKRLLSFARQPDVTIQRINLKGIVLEVLGFLAKEANYKSIEIHVDMEIPEIESDRSKLQQIFLNLIQNAFAAMNEGGRVDINAARKAKNEIFVTVTDNGCGITQEHLSQIFEPFFTTKSKQGGTGLGLSITYGLVQELGGNITVKSQVGQGTSFTVTLPLKRDKKENIHANPVS